MLCSLTILILRKIKDAFIFDISYSPQLIRQSKIYISSFEILFHVLSRKIFLLSTSRAKKYESRIKHCISLRYNRRIYHTIFRLLNTKKNSWDLMHKSRIHTQRYLIKAFTRPTVEDEGNERYFWSSNWNLENSCQVTGGRASSATDPHLHRSPYPSISPSQSRYSISLVAVCSMRSCGHVDRSLPCNERNTDFPSRVLPFLFLVPTSVSPWARALKRAGAGQKRRNPSRLGRRSGF